MALAQRFSTPAQPSTASPIPEVMRLLPQWIVWRKGTTNPNTGKFPKIPFDPTTGKPSSDKDASTWMPYQTARRASALIGFCLSEHDPLTMIDLDHCVINGVIDPRALQLVQQIGGYWEFSPSGTGVKGWVYGKLAENITGTIDGISVEIYSRKRFGAVTGKAVPGFAGEPVPAQAVLDRLAAQLTPEPVTETPRIIGPMQPVSSTSAADLDTQAQTLLAQLRRGGIVPTEFQRLSQELKAINRAFIRAVASAYNDAGSIDNELERRGCDYISTSDTGKRYYSGLATDQHSHDITLKVEDGPEGGTVWAFSPNSRLYLAGRHGMKRFDIVVHLDHNGNRVAAARALFGVSATPAPAKTTPSAAAQPEPTIILEQIAARQAEAQRKRDARKAEAVATVANARARLASDTNISTRAGMVLLALFDIFTADGKIRTSARPSNAQLMERTGYTSVRTVRDALRELETSGYLAEPTRYANSDGETWQGGKGTVWRTLLRGQCLTVENRGIAPESSNLDHEYGKRVAYKGGATCPPPEATGQEEINGTPQTDRCVQGDTTGASTTGGCDSRGNQATGTGVDHSWLWTEDGGRSGVSGTSAENPTGQASVEPYTLDYWAHRAAEAEARASQPTPRTVPTEEARRRFCADMQREADKIEHQRLAAVAAESAAAKDATEQATLLESVEQTPIEPVRLVPPSDTAQRTRYYKLMGAARKARSKGNSQQAAILERQAHALREPLPAVQQARVVAASPEPEHVAPPLQATSAGEREPTILPPATVAHVRKLLAESPMRAVSWLRNANNFTWWECSHADDLPFDAMTFRAAALAAIGYAAVATAA